MTGDKRETVQPAAMDELLDKSTNDESDDGELDETRSSEDSDEKRRLDGVVQCLRCLELSPHPHTNLPKVIPLSIAQPEQRKTSLARSPPHAFDRNSIFEALPS